MQVIEGTKAINAAKDAPRRILLFGPSKVGKTTLACNLLGKENTIVLCYDPDGIKSVMPIDHILVDPQKPWEDSLVILTELRKYKGKKKCIVVSDLTTASMLFLRTAGTFTDSRKTYGVAIDRTRQLIEQLRNIDWATIIYECVDVLITDEKENVTSSLPSVIGKATLAPSLPMYMDDVFYLQLPKVTREVNPVTRRLEARTQRLILTSSDGAKLAGTRLNKAGDELILENEVDVTIYPNDFSNIERLRKNLYGS